MSAAKVFSSVPKTNCKRKKNAELEDDCGFVFRRKAPKTTKSFDKPPPDAVESKVRDNSMTRNDKKVVENNPLTPKKVTNSIESQEPSINPTPSKRQLLERQRRRSSLSGLAAATAKRRSSIGIGFTHDCPPQNVEPSSYCRHVLPDLPGPIKMKQILIWAVQKSAKEMSIKSSAKKISTEWDEMVAEPITQGLHTNELVISWYQRPSIPGASLSYRPNPINTDMKECLGLYQKYYKQLAVELSKWKSIESEVPPNFNLPSLSYSNVDVPVPKTSSELVSIGKWLHRLPFHVDRLGWLLHVYGNFEGRSKQCCEDVFRLIFRQFFSSKALPNQTNPIHVLKALSSAPTE